MEPMCDVTLQANETVCRIELMAGKEAAHETTFIAYTGSRA
jgi:hypothetical protein